MESNPTRKFTSFLRNTAARLRMLGAPGPVLAKRPAPSTPRRMVDGKEVEVLPKGANRAARRKFGSTKGFAFRRVNKLGEYVHLSPPSYRVVAVGENGMVKARQGFWATRRGRYLHSTKGLRDRVIQRKWVWA